MKRHKSTLRERVCTSKVAYLTDQDARRAIVAAKRRTPGLKLSVYRCPFCKTRHLTSHKKTGQQRVHIRIAARRQKGAA